MLLKFLSAGGNYRLFIMLSMFAQVITIILFKQVATQCGGNICGQFFLSYTAIIMLILLRVVFWNLALSMGKLSDIYRYTALVPIFVLFFSASLLNESVSIVSGIGAGIVATAMYMQQRGIKKSV